MISENEILALLKEAKFESIEKINISAQTKRGLKYLFSFTDEYDGKETNLVVGFDENFPLSLPSFFIKDNSNFQFIPHVEDDGWICYTRDDNVFLDYRNPGGVILEAYQLAKKTIQSGINGSNKIDFLNEFEAYWLKFKDVEVVFGNLKISHEPSLIKIGVKGGTRFVVSEETEYFEGIKRFIDLDKKGITYENAIYIPLKPGYFPAPLRSADLISFGYFKEVIRNGIEEKTKKQLMKLCERATKAREYVVVSFQQPDGVYSLFGFYFTGTKKHPVIEENFNGKIKPFAIRRLDKEYMVRRGGNGATFFDKKGLVIGAGSVGGFVIEELVRAGFLNLTIVDNDKLSIDNCYRHYLGFEYLDTPKVEGIKRRIEKIFPHSKIDAVICKIESLISNKKIDLKQYHFIIIATGSVTVNHFINQYMKSKLPGLPVFFLWNEPYGIGGHVLLSNLDGDGCYACLYDTPEGYNRASFASKDQPKTFLKSISGCATMYTPFSSIDSRSTACLAVKQVIQVVTGRLNKDTIYSWRGDSTLFLQEGFNVSERFSFSEKELADSTGHFRSPTCSVCNEKDSK